MRCSTWSKASHWSLLKFSVNIDIQFLVVKRHIAVDLGAFEVGIAIPPNDVFCTRAVRKLDVIVIRHTLWSECIRIRNKLWHMRNKRLTLYGHAVVKLDGLRSSRLQSVFGMYERIGRPVSYRRRGFVVLASSTPFSSTRIFRDD